MKRNFLKLTKFPILIKDLPKFQNEMNHSPEAKTQA